MTSSSTFANPTHAEAKLELARRCVAWDRRFYGVCSTPIPDHLKGASWLSVRAWFRIWFASEFGTTAAEKLAAMCSLREVTRVEQLELNGLEAHSRELQEAARRQLLLFPGARA